MILRHGEGASRDEFGAAVAVPEGLGPRKELAVNSMGCSKRRIVFNALLALATATACTQLFGGRENTLMPLDKQNTGIVPPFVEPRSSGICVPGQARCEGALLQTCAADGGGWLTLERCPGAGACQ